MGARCGFGCGPRRPAAGNVLAAYLLAHSLRHLVDLAARSAGEHQHHYRLRTLVFIAGALSAARASGYSLIAWLSAAWAGPPWRVGSRNWFPIGAGLSKGVGGGALVRPGPAPHASRALRVPAGPAAPALDPEVPAGPGQRETAGRAAPGPQFLSA